MNALRAQDSPEALSDYAYEQVLTLILSGALKHGQAITASRLSRQLGVSRSPVHDALLRLEGDGVISSDGGSRLTVVSVTGRHIYEVYEMRKLLEGEAAARAAGRMTIVETEPLRASVRSLRALGDGEPVSWRDAWAEADEQFHTAIASGSDMALLQRDIERYRLLHRVMNRTILPWQHLETAIEQHLEILTAIERGDRDSARELMVHHLESWQRYFIEELSGAHPPEAHTWA